MLWVFVSSRHSDQIRQVRRRVGGAVRSQVRMISYESVRWRPGLPGGAYLFTDIETLGPRMYECACKLADSRRVTERVGEALVALAEQGAGRRRIPSEALRRMRPRFCREWRN